jgi:hypothetical protein
VIILGGVWASGIQLREHEHLKYFDLDYISRVRENMNRGTGKMFSSREHAGLGKDLAQDALNTGRGLVFFFLSVDITGIRNVRQLAALPEVFFLLCCLPYLLVGTITSWRRFPRRVLPLLLVTVAIIAVYGGAATNMGALYRWRVQAMPLLMLIGAYGAVIHRRGVFAGAVRYVERTTATASRPRRPALKRRRSGTPVSGREGPPHGPVGP